MSYCPNPKKHRTSETLSALEAAAVSDVEAASLAPISMTTLQQPAILNRVLLWLTPKELAVCSKVCKPWTQDIQLRTWKQVAKNVNATSMAALELGLARENKVIPSKSITVGLSKITEIERDQMESIPDVDWPEPTLRPEDLFILVELEGGDVKAAWSKSLKEALHDHDFIRPKDLDCPFERCLGSNSSSNFLTAVRLSFERLCFKRSRVAQFFGVSLPIDS
uniref:F-box domain-containing protein n=1 Tax=Amphora coffeiformis TaxID=265554 RepID=A0A7S3L041_9STRA|mmetsp:Transcript_17813/g.33578  ORF Transcript_17813/g.33578 Transcript_17813/m.33578 type:complete len:222 (-) Transcript_17813:195-860(-)